MRAVMLVENDAVVSAMLSTILNTVGGYTVRVAPSLAAALMDLSHSPRHVTAVISDIALPDGTGFELCTEIRNRNLGIPVILLSNADSEDNLGHGFQAGASDYIRKPCRPLELAARVRAAVRSARRGRDTSIAIGPFAFCPASKTLKKPGQSRPIRLTEKEAHMLHLLYDAQGRPVPTAELMQEIWGCLALNGTHVVQSHVYRLRQKLEPAPQLPTIVLTATGGYRLSVTQA